FGLWCGAGLLAVWRHLARVLGARVSFAGAATVPVFGLALLPLGLNWEWSSRADDYAARDWAYNVLMSVAPYGVLFTNGDNDTFPLWYLQEVEGLRRDVTVMVTGYLNTDWYARQVRDLTQPCPVGVSARSDPTRIICQRLLESGQLPAALAARAAHTTAPDDSILPLTDAEIADIAATPFVAEESLELRAGALKVTVPAGTVMFPADTFVAAILKATLGKRPIYFAAPHPTIDKLGLQAYTVRQGLALALHNGNPQPSRDAGIIALPDSPLSPVTGAFVDLPLTESLLRTTFVQRGRLLELDRPFVDFAVSNILLQYAWVHYTAAQAYAVNGSASAAEQHVRSARWWEARTQGS
ncbi:MAG TPA: hypothetical protein VK864_08945, partial [Longimicrobiales bacterium]|nr:hypothetical protein [Longimicrobiales bacterium]